MNANKANLKRRHFLMTLGAGGAAAAAAAAAVAARAGAAATGAQPAQEPAQAAGISEHARKYYRTARI